MLNFLARICIWVKDVWYSRPTCTDRGISRSEHWPTIRRRHLLKESICQWCGGKEFLEVHHIAPFHLHPELELSDDNLITLCEDNDLKCHLRQGHFGNWENYNPEIRNQCNAMGGTNETSI